MNKELRWTRWHRFDTDGNKYIKRFETHDDPSNLIEEGYSAWQRGTGPLAPEQYNNVVNAIRKTCLGVPKSETQKEKMRQAKLGKPKTEEHKKNMSKAWEKRRLRGFSEEHKKNMSVSLKQPRQELYRAAMAQLEQLRQGNS